MLQSQYQLSALDLADHVCRSTQKENERIVTLGLSLNNPSLRVTDGLLCADIIDSTRVFYLMPKSTYEKQHIDGQLRSMESSLRSLDLHVSASAKRRNGF